MTEAHEGPAVLVEGDGIAAACVARLLSDASVALVREPNERPKLASILLSGQSQQLFREIFPSSPGAPDLFDGFARICRRMVLWGAAKSALDLPHEGVVVPEAELVRRLWERVPSALTSVAMTERPAWQVRSSRTGVGDSDEQRFGSREACLSKVQLTSDAEAETCWVESVADGWLFLLSLGDGAGTLISVGAAPVDLLGTSRLVADRVQVVLAHSPQTPAYPRLLRSLAHGMTLACGGAAMSFDPLCGEGAGNAVREAFLASAVVRAGLDGADPLHLNEHYASRLLPAFRRHLEICLSFYTTGGTGQFWEAESQATRRGLDLLAGKQRQELTSRFRLVDRQLVAL